MRKTRLFRKGTYLAVLSDDDDFWLCFTKKDVFLDDDTMAIVWMEKVINFMIFYFSFEYIFD